MIGLEESKALVRRLVDIVNAGDLEALEEVASGQIAQEARRWIGPFRDSFPDFRMEVRDVIAEADKVVGYFKCSGTHQGKRRGIPPSGRRFESVDEIYIFRVEGGKLSAAIAVVEDNLTRMRQLGHQSGNVRAAPVESFAIPWKRRSRDHTNWLLLRTTSSRVESGRSRSRSLWNAAPRPTRARRVCCDRRRLGQA